MGIARAAAVVERVDVSAYTVPTERPEADGALHWNGTTIVIAEEARGGNATGPGYSYAGTAAAVFIRDVLTPAAGEGHVMAVPGIWEPMRKSIRNHLDFRQAGNGLLTTIACPG